MSGWGFNDDHRTVECMQVGPAELRAGDRVGLRPRRRAEMLDLALEGRDATIASIEQDFEAQVDLAVTVDDPGRDLGAVRQPGHRFFFAPDGIEIVVRHEAGP
jgi:hypothetical protein